ncbi:MAG: hypothetical protein ACHQ01_03165 [Candidatus Limnocylindrales bacterium]
MEWLVWPVVIVIVALALVGLPVAADMYKSRLKAGQENDLRQLVDRYEQLAEKTMDAEQRVAADVADVRARLAAVEQILRSVG